ncbi:MAG: hypothetical protein KDE09_21165, partial [Anaerolineales bacterium]|nr:hypothetical protein [Anaerolineales bacterium]
MLTPHLPLYARARYFLRILEGVSVQLYHSLYSAIWSKRGTPQAQADWTDPEAWIPERLDGEESKLALRIWRESNGELNPRYLRGSWLYANRHGLLEAGTNGKLTITDRGCAFLDGNPDLIAILDEAEGMLALLRLVVERGPAQRSTLLPGFTTFCHNFTTWRSESPIKLALYSRLMNLMDRG